MSTRGSSKVAVGVQEMGCSVMEEEQLRLQEQLAVEVHFHDPRALLCQRDSYVVIRVDLQGDRVVSLFLLARQ